MGAATPERVAGSVVVVGGGYAGVAVARSLDRRVQVTLVEPRDAFVHTVAALRALVHTEWAETLCFPYDHLLRNGEVVRDRAVAVGPGRVALASGRTLVADAVVVATGSRYPYPAKPEVDDRAEVLARLAATRAELSGAGRVLLVGAGPVGVELAAELKLAWPSMQVVLLDAAPALLAGRPHTDRLRNELKAQLEELGVELRLGQPLAALPTARPGHRAPIVVQPIDHSPFEVDLWFRCFGVEPAADVLGQELASARAADGSVAVDEHLQVVGAPGVFALGDASDADAKMAGLALLQAPIVAGNVIAHLQGEPLPKRYDPIGPMIMVSIGPDGGAGESPAGFHDGPQVADMKASDLLVGFVRDLLRCPEPATATAPD
jgi:NADH dehydrogenase FAD-containing subunit